ncbi:molybdopterin molybdotransferase MoeA [Zunongwangia sp. F363]|uniref:Molybdopterin molybdenumtransferase n=1 Tax=Autumnicola tepida TaxID=3075595 RepID=A0ABU3C8J9_9FLAO|nr:molybdopterin molybdotransferase MoeA [Zunongwangia sp. F363]MDT0642665.1 molybdopterin molybdotransferase MoeA [Zunongwangia sp. F363]
MINQKEAFQKVLETVKDFGNEVIPLLEATGRILAEDIEADRDFPPFDRVTKDGYAINSKALDEGVTTFEIESIGAAGSPRAKLENYKNCIEIMTGAVLPENTNTIIMYEHTQVKDGKMHIEVPPEKGQNIHLKGGDISKGEIILTKNRRISGKEMGVMAAVGKAQVLVKKLPKVCLISTGDELVNIGEQPLPHQIRNSNGMSLYGALSAENIYPEFLHLKDEKKQIREKLKAALEENDVLLLSGGVSKGKFDYLPEIMEELEVEKIFHRVAQQPGKPLWFGVQNKMGTNVFSFPGNPISTFVNFHIYFKPWLKKCLNIRPRPQKVQLQKEFENKGDLTRFLLVSIASEEGVLKASLIGGNGSGDMISLTRADGIIVVPPKSAILSGSAVEFIAF